jgi:uncharacterized membrane protein
MGYLFCLFALLVGVTKGYCGKKTSGTVTTLPGTMLFNAVRMLICIPIGFLCVLIYTGSPSLAIDGKTLLISVLSGAATSCFVVSWIACVRKGAYMMVDVFLTLGVIVPVVLCRIFFDEAVRWNQLLGILLLVIAAYIMCTYNKSIGKEKIRPSSILLLTFCGASNGLTSFSQKWFRYESTADVSLFNFYTYIFSAVILIVCWLTVRAAHPGESGGTIGKKDLIRLGGYVTVMSLCLFLHSLFSTMAAGYLTSSQLYPLMQGGSLVLSMLMSAVFFGEKINLRCVTGIAITFAALLCINLL